MATAMAEKPKAKKQEPEWTMPKVCQGQPVIWYPDKGGAGGTTAIVTAVYPKCISVSIMHEQFHNFDPRDTVRHIEDPNIKDIDIQDYGCWGHTEATKELDQFMEDARQAILAKGK